MSQRILQDICDLIQQDVTRRGLRTDPDRNLVTETAGDFQAACRSIAETEKPAVAIVTGFYIPTARPPCGETDGPLGALFLARALTPLGVRVLLATDPFCARALEAGVRACGLDGRVPVIRLAPTGRAELPPELTHLIALERAGPSHTPGSVGQARDQFLREVPPEHHGRLHTMRGRDITDQMAPAHRLFESARGATIGIGDGGNEIGMGKVPWDVIRRNVPGGGLVACRVPTDHLIVCGVSNWGAYGLAAGVALRTGRKLSAALFDPARERELLRVMAEEGPLVDGVLSKPALSVDGLPFEQYVRPLGQIGRLLGL